MLLLFIMTSMLEALLVLEDGTIVKGKGFGVERTVFGELVFNTSMVGYQEALTDPSYRGQILMMTYPLIGNYGTNSEDFESEKIQVEGFVVRNVCDTPSHPKSSEKLSDFLRRFNVPGIQGVDTRALTLKIRLHGTVKCALCSYEEDKVPDFQKILSETRAQPHISEKDLVKKVSISKPKRIESPYSNSLEIVLIDCGVKNSIIECLLKRGVNVTVVPYNTSASEIIGYNPKGVLVSNGPGDPVRVIETINTIKKLFGKMPLYGICLGLQLIALASGAKTYKLKFGHRGINQPIKDLENDRVFISSQNHGFAIDSNRLNNTGLVVTQINLNDNTVEAIRHKDLPIAAVQYHPEASPGPNDTYFFFDEFVNILRQY